MKLIILRGPSGTGKTTIATHLAIEDVDWETTIAHEADQFFMGPASHIYKFDVNMLGAAHRFCQLAVEREMFHCEETVIVSNTSTRLKEMQPYLDLAAKYGYEVEIVRTPGPWDPDVLFTRNTHGVPLDTLRKQIQRYAAHPDEIEWSNMTIFDHD